MTINANSGTLTLAGSASTVAGDYSTLTLTIDGTKSSSFTITIAAAATKSVSVGAQNGTLTEKTAGTVTFPVTTANIANGSYSVTAKNLPTGVNVQGQVDISANKGTLTLAGNTSTVAGTYSTLTLTIDGVTSGAFTLTITAASSSTKSVSVGAQNGALTEKKSGTVTFPVTTVNIPNGTYSATVANLPTGVGVQGQVVINAGNGTLTLAGNTSTVAGVYSTLKLTINSVTSNAFTLTIKSEKEKFVMEQVSIKYSVAMNADGSGGRYTMILTYKDKGWRHRMDSWFTNPIGKSVTIDNYFNNTKWTADQNEKGVINVVWDGRISTSGRYQEPWSWYDESGMEALVQKKETIAGKMCNVYGFGGATWHVWNNQILRIQEANGVVTFEAVKIVETVPDNAFNRSFDVGWI